MKHFFTLSVGLCLLTSNAEEFDFGEFMANESRIHSFTARPMPGQVSEVQTWTFKGKVGRHFYFEIK